MAAIAERVHARQDEIALIESRIVELPDEAIVEITLDDGRKLKGLVTARPTIQTFRDAEGREGVNALLRLDDLERPGHSHQLWLDRVSGIFHMGSD
jgi:hypothetical protein